MENLLVSGAFLDDRGIEVVKAERGGNITYHGPGQLVTYPIVDLKRLGLGVAEYVGKLEEIMILTAQEVGVAVQRNSCGIGVWAGMKKLGNVGVAVSRNIAFHGFSFNIDLSPEPFGWINPCGFDNIQITTLDKEGAKGVTIDSARAIIKRKTEDVLGLKFINIKPDLLRNR